MQFFSLCVIYFFGSFLLFFDLYRYVSREDKYLLSREEKKCFFVQSPHVFSCACGTTTTRVVDCCRWWFLGAHMLGRGRVLGMWTETGFVGCVRCELRVRECTSHRRRCLRSCDDAMRCSSSSSSVCWPPALRNLHIVSMSVVLVVLSVCVFAHVNLERHVHFTYHTYKRHYFRCAF